MRKTSWFFVIVLLSLLGSAGLSAARRLGPRPAVWKDNDMASIPEPKRHRDSMYYDFLSSTFGKAPKTALSHLGEREPAWNVNAWDEVPDSSWFTNRIHLHPMTPEEVRRGPNLHARPDLSGPLVILEGKTAGITPGFGRTRDARGDVYFMKFDPPDYPEIGTGAEMVASRLFHAMGYHVPEDWIVYFRADQLKIDPKATFSDKSGRERKLTQADVDEVLKGIARTADGRYRAVASRGLAGRNIGGFRFHGTRKDDANDLIPHEHRRELRGLRLFCAWLNHDDIRVGNTLDFFVEEGGRKFVRHYLQDFGSTMGSDSNFPNRNRVGHSYIFDVKQMAGPLFSLGLYQPDWREHPTPVKFSSIGRFESARFSPGDWKANFPIVSFAHMDDADAFWAARIVMSFTDAQIAAAVDAGEYSDPEAARFLTQTLVERRNKVGAYGLQRTSPLAGFKVEAVEGRSPVLRFENLAERYGLMNAGQSRYAYQPGRLGAQRLETLGQERTAEAPEIALAPLAPEIASIAAGDSARPVVFALVIRVVNPIVPATGRAVRVYLERRAGSGEFRLLGFDREN